MTCVPRRAHAGLAPEFVAWLNDHPARPGRESTVGRVALSGRVERIPDVLADQDLIGAIRSNLDKVVQHGKRADSIVKNMLLHSREGSGERSTTNVNAMVEEALNLAYHGARAEKPGFNVERGDHQITRPECRRRRGLSPGDDPGPPELDFERILRNEQAQAERGRRRL